MPLKRTWGGVRRYAPHSAVVLALLAAPALGAQSPAAARGSVTDSAGGAVAGATVTVLGEYRSTRSGTRGEWEIRLPPGRARLRAAALGFRPETLSVALPLAPGDSVRFRLRSAPVLLEGLTVESPRVPAMGQTVTPATVRQVPPLGEPDVFRAVVLLPGVAQPNDLKGRIHLAGGASDETGVRLDGHPLHDPFHLLGLFGAFNVAALDRADVLMHHLPPAFGERLSGYIDLTTRRAGARPEFEGVAGLLTSGATASTPDVGRGIDLLASGRVTYLDRVAPLVDPTVPRLGFHDGVVRVGVPLAGWRAEAVGFTSRDYFRPEPDDGMVSEAPVHWGESLVGVRAAGSAGGWEVLMRGSWGESSVRMDETRVDVAPADARFVSTRRTQWSGAVEAERSGAWWRAVAGASVDRPSHRQEWSAPGLVDDIFSPSTPSRYSGREAQTRVAAHAESSLRLGGGWAASVGGRAWAAPAVRFAPRALLSFTPRASVVLEGAWNRRFQFDAQLEEPIEGSITAPVFLLTKPRVADVASGSARWTRAPGAGRTSGTVQLQGFHKAYRDRAVLAGRGDSVFPDFERATGTSVGAMSSARVSFAGGSTVQASYTLQRVRETVGGETVPTSWDVPHSLSTFASVPAGRGWTLNAVYQGHSGRATTPVVARVFVPAPDDPFQLDARYIRGARNSVRVPPYHRLDLGGRRAWNARGARWTLSIQALNVFFRSNPVDYDWTQYFRAAEGGRTGSGGKNGLPLVPSATLEVQW